MLTVGQELHNAGYQVDLLVVDDTGELRASVPSELNKISCGKNRVILAFVEILKYLRQVKPMVILTALPHLSIVTICAKTVGRIDTAVIVTEHNTLSQSVRFSTGLKTRCLPWLMRFFYRFASSVVAVSDGVGADLQKMVGLKTDQLVVIPNPVITHKLIQQSYEQPAHSWFEAPNQQIILGVGRLTIAKDLENLIRSQAIVRRKVPAKLVILGKGPQLSSIKSLIVKLGLNDEVSLCGFLDNPYSLMRNCSVFVLSSRWEGLPTVLIEALACGAKVVSTDCPSGPYEILNGGELGTLVPCSNPEALASAILGALTDSTRASAHYSLDRYSARSVGREYCKLVLEHSSPG